MKDCLIRVRNRIVNFVKNYKTPQYKEGTVHTQNIHRAQNAHSHSAFGVKQGPSPQSMASFANMPAAGTTSTAPSPSSAALFMANTNNSNNSPLPLNNPNGARLLQKIPQLIHQLKSKYDAERREIAFEVQEHLRSMRVAQSDAIDAQSFLLHTLEDLTNRLDAMESASIDPQSDMAALSAQMAHLTKQMKRCQEEQQLLKAALYSDRLTHEEECHKRLVAEEHLLLRIRQAEEGSELLRTHLHKWRSVNAAVMENGKILMQFVDDNHVRHGQQNLLTLQSDVLQELSAVKRSHAGLMQRLQQLTAIVGQHEERDRARDEMVAMRQVEAIAKGHQQRNSINISNAHINTAVAGEKQSSAAAAATQASATASHFATPSRSSSVVNGLFSQQQPQQQKPFALSSSFDPNLVVSGAAAHRRLTSSSSAPPSPPHHHHELFAHHNNLNVQGGGGTDATTNAAMDVNGGGGGEPYSPATIAGLSYILGGGSAITAPNNTSTQKSLFGGTATAAATASNSTTQRAPTTLSSSHSSSLRQKLTDFYTQYNPSKLASIDTIMLEYLGAEEELMAALEVHYGAMGYFSSSTSSSSTVKRR